MPSILPCWTKKKRRKQKRQRRKNDGRKKGKRKESKKKRLKAEARAKKAEERARKEEEKAKRTEEKAKERALKTEERSKRKTTNKKRAEPATLSVPLRAEPATSSEPSRTSSCTEKNEQPRQKKANTVLSRSEDLNSGECCVCFDTYDEDVALETGRDWVECACQRWLHEECAEDCVIDPNGQERLCPFCLDVFGL